jgi:hypothetical protein
MHMKQRLFKWMMAIAIVSSVSVSCSKDDEEPDNEEELITTLRVTVVETGSAATSTFTFRDVDGPGGNPPGTFDSILLNASRSYAVSLQFLNESVSPAEDITEEVEEEDVDHQVYFEPASVAITALNLNADRNGLPLGTNATWNTGAAGTGSLRITLKHKPGAKAAGDPVSKGETDVEINFPARIR